MSKLGKINNKHDYFQKNSFKLLNFFKNFSILHHSSIHLKSTTIQTHSRTLVSLKSFGTWKIPKKKKFTFFNILAFLPKLQKNKFWPNSAVKRKIVGFLKMSPKTKLYAERRYGPFFCQKFFSQTKTNLCSREIFFGFRKYCGTSKFAPNWEKPKCD